MKELVNPIRILASLVGFFTLFSSHTLADTDLDHSGKIQLQTERIGQDEEEREVTEAQDNKETELEKKAPDLFEEKTRAAIESKKTEMEQTTGKLEQGLFISPNEPNTSLKDTEKNLFASDYTVHDATAPNHEEIGNNQNDSMSSKTLSAFLGFIVVGCGGLYSFMRKMMG